MADWFRRLEVELRPLVWILVAWWAAIIFLPRCQDDGPDAKEAAHSPAQEASPSEALRPEAGSAQTPSPSRQPPSRSAASLRDGDGRISHFHLETELTEAELRAINRSHAANMAIMNTNMGAVICDLEEAGAPGAGVSLLDDGQGLGLLLSDYSDHILVAAVMADTSSVRLIIDDGTRRPPASTPGFWVADMTFAPLCDGCLARCTGVTETTIGATVRDNGGHEGGTR